MVNKWNSYYICLCTFLFKILNNHIVSEVKTAYKLNDCVVYECICVGLHMCAISIIDVCRYMSIYCCRFPHIAGLWSNGHQTTSALKASLHIYNALTIYIWLFICKTTKSIWNILFNVSSLEKEITSSNAVCAW